MNIIMIGEIVDMIDNILFLYGTVFGTVGTILWSVIFKNHKKGNEKEDGQENIDDDYWNNQYDHNKISYKAQGEFYRDMRTLINYPSYIASNIVLFNKLNKSTEEQTLLAILKWCDDHITYVSDRKNNCVLEHWEDSDIVLQKKRGDCEDKALAFKALTLACGIPDYKVKIVAGWVEDPMNDDMVSGHAYPIVLIKDDWYTFDPTYYPDYTPIKDRIRHKYNRKYKDIWWTFNKEYRFCQRSVTIKGDV